MLRRALSPAPLPTPQTGILPAPDDRLGLTLVLSGTMLIGAACGVVLAVRAWGIPHAPPASSLYALILAGALTGTAGALLISDPWPRSDVARPRPSAWILAIGVAAGLLLGAAGTWLFVNAPRALPQRPGIAAERPS